MAPALRSVLHGESVAVRQCIALSLAGGALHGLALGASSGEPALAVYSAIKVPLLLLCSCLVTLPNFYVLHALLGLSADFAAACRGLWAAQAALAIALGAFAPVVVFVFASTNDGYLLTLLDGLLFALAAVVGQVVLARHYRPLLARDRRHRVTLASWAVLYVFFAVQLAWVLRPFLGTPGYPVEFLRSNALEQNAYVVLIEHFARLLR
ncbi:MAG TPA: hypothetical protein VF384_13030 [Planctomycetota bacterium]